MKEYNFSQKTKGDIDNSGVKSTLFMVLMIFLSIIMMKVGITEASEKNIIKNGGFNYDTQYWELGGKGVYHFVPEGARGGHGSVKGVNVNYKNLHQRSSVHVKPNTEYTYSFDYKITKNDDTEHQNVEFIVARGGTPWSEPYLVHDLVNINDRAWHTKAGTFNTGNNSSIVTRITGASKNQEFYIDNIRVYQSGVGTNVNSGAKNTASKKIMTQTTSVLGQNIFGRNLFIGKSGADVRRLQEVLNMPQRYHTGYYGPLTRGAVRRYQLRRGIRPSIGYFGPITRAAVRKDANGVVSVQKQIKKVVKKYTTPVIGKVMHVSDAHQARMCHELSTFKKWLGGERGAIGEFGVSFKDNPEKHRELVNKFYSIANAYHFDTFVWSVGEWWGDYKLAPFRWDRNHKKLIKNKTADILTSDFTTRNYVRGINLSGAEFAIANNNGNISTSGRGYLYHNTANIWTELGNNGMTHVRYPVRLERLFHKDGTFNQSDLKELRSAMKFAKKAGIQVLIEPHNYGRMKIDGAFHKLSDNGQFSGRLYAKMMGEIARIAKGEGAIYAIGLMNEPEALNSQEWEHFSQMAVNTIRQAGFKKVIYIPTWNWQGIQDVTRHNKPWIKDAGIHVYEVHQYFDLNHSGAYDDAYVNDEDKIKQKGYTAGECML